MATFTVNKDIKARIAPFNFDIIAGVTQSAPDDLMDEIVDVIEGTSGGFVVTQLTTDRADAGISAATASTIASGYIDAHAISADPHTAYATNADLTTHEGAADPHTGYQKESEKAAASGYASLDGSTLVPVAQLGSGSADSTKFLRGDRTWAAPAGGGAFTGAIIYATVTQSLATQAFTAVTFDTVLIDSGSFFNSASPTRLTVATTGVYDIFGGITVAANTTGDTRQLRVRINGSTGTYARGYLSIRPGSNAVGQLALNVKTKVRLAANDYVELIAFQDGTGAIVLGQTGGTDAANVFGISLLGTSA